MKISPVNNSLYSFKSSENQQSILESNPITKGGEKAILVKGTFLTGLGLGARLLFELMDDGFVVDAIGEEAKKINNKTNSHLSSAKKIISGIGIWGGLVLLAIGAFATLYTLFNVPKINYKAKVNAFQKQKEMDVYIKGNQVEKGLYTQMNDKAKNADEKEKSELRKQYVQMQAAKNRVPDFIKIKK